MPTNDAAFREAVETMGTALSSADYLAAKARVLALYAERQGEVTAPAGAVYEVRSLDYTPALLPSDKDTAPKTVHLCHVFLGPNFKPGDRVRVTRCEDS